MLSIDWANYGQTQTQNTETKQQYYHLKQLFTEVEVASGENLQGPRSGEINITTSLRH